MSRKAGLKLSLYTCPKGKKKRLVMNFQFIFAFSETNFRIAEQTLNFDFKNAWKILENFNLSARSAEATNLKNFNFENLRKGRDSNSRYRFRYAAFRERCLEPLGHLSNSSVLYQSSPIFGKVLEMRF